MVFSNRSFGPLIWQLLLWGNSFYPRICCPCVSIIRTVAFLPTGNTICFWEQLFVFTERNDFIWILEFSYLTLGFGSMSPGDARIHIRKSSFEFFAGLYFRQSDIFKARYIHFNVLEPPFKGKGSFPFSSFSVCIISVQKFTSGLGNEKGMREHSNGEH